MFDRVTQIPPLPLPHITQSRPPSALNTFATWNEPVASVWMPPR